MVFSMECASQPCISVWLLASPPATRLHFSRNQDCSGDATSHGPSFWQNEIEFMNENNSARKHLRRRPDHVLRQGRFHLDPFRLRMSLSGAPLKAETAPNSG